MPLELPPPALPEVDLDSAPLKLSYQALEDGYALSLVKNTFFDYETQRTNNGDRRWVEHDSSYFGYRAAKTWEGTQVQRSNLAIPITFDQVESALPLISQAVFPAGEPWFDVEPMPGADPKEARAVRDNLAYDLDYSDESGVPFEAEAHLAFKDVLLHGNGGVHIEYDAARQQTKAKWVDIRDFYFDPYCPLPNVDSGRGVIWRKLMTVDDIDQLRTVKGMRIPEKPVLTYMAKAMQRAYADATKTASEALRGHIYSPGVTDYTRMPSDRHIEVLIYYSRARIIWVFNREWVAYNERNPYGFIPLAFAPCYPVLGRFLAMSIADVQEWNQKYMEALLNGRLDLLHLMLEPPRVRRRGVPLTPTQGRWRPGMVDEVDGEVGHELAVLYPPDALTNVFQELQYIELASDKRTGITPLASGGIPRPSNANRTSGGMQMQMSGAMSRLMFIAKNIEHYMLLPMLRKMYKMKSYHTQPGDMLPGREGGNTSNYYPVDAGVYQKPVRFCIQAASRMISRTYLQQAVPFYMQYLMNGPFLQNLAKTGKTVDFEEFFQMTQDAFGTGKKYALIRGMSQEEMQASQAPPPEAMMDMQKAEMDNQTKLQLAQTKAQADREQSMLDTQLKQAEAQMKAEVEQVKLQTQKELAAIKIQLEQAKMQLAMQKAGVDLQVKQVESQGKLQESQMNQAMSQQEHGLKLRQMAEEFEMKKKMQAEGGGMGKGMGGGMMGGGSKGGSKDPKAKAEVKEKSPRAA